MEAADKFEQLLASSAMELGVDLERVSLVQGADLQGPATVGLWRHTLLLPSELIERGVTGGQEEREELATALAHELVHIRRRDFACNLFYEVITLPVAWHPLLLLTRGQVNETRELAEEGHAQNMHCRGPEQEKHSRLEKHRHGHRVI